MTMIHETHRAGGHNRTQARILEAAESLFARQGFAATRLEDIAQEVAIKRASLVYYYRSKRELYEAVLDGIFTPFGERLAKALAAIPRERHLEVGVSEWVSFMAERPLIARLVLREITDAEPNDNPIIRSRIVPLFRSARELVESAQAAGLRANIDPLHLATAIAGATLLYVIARPLIDDAGSGALSDPEQLEMHRRELIRIAQRLLGAESSSL